MSFFKWLIFHFKNPRRFSLLALDQVHKQNDKEIELVHGEKRMVNRKDISGMER